MSTFKADAKPFVLPASRAVSNPWALETFAWGAWAVGCEGSGEGEPLSETQTSAS